MIKNKIFLIFGTIAISLLIFCGIYIYMQNHSIDNLQTELQLKAAEIAVKDANNINLTSTIKSQNEKIEQIENNYVKKNKEFEIWKNKPAEIKYKEVIKNVEVKSNECKDIKTIINDIRNTSF